MTNSLSESFVLCLLEVDSFPLDHLLAVVQKEQTIPEEYSNKETKAVDNEVYLVFKNICTKE